MWESVLREGRVFEWCWRRRLARSLWSEGGWVEERFVRIWFLSLGGWLLGWGRGVDRGKDLRRGDLGEAEGMGLV